MRQVFYDKIREEIFGGRLSSEQVKGIERLSVAWKQYGTGDDRHIAYLLATVAWETGRRMQPVRECFAKSDAEARRCVAGRQYGKPTGPWWHVYYGRGDVQLTWIDNYRKMGALLKIDLVRAPDMALDPKISARIVVEGMTKGLSTKGDFTGVSLEDYINSEKTDFYNARKVVNALDKAAEIAEYAEVFLKGLEADKLAQVRIEPIKPRPPIELPNEVELPIPQPVEVTPVKTESVSSQKVFGVIPAVRKIAAQIKWAAVLVVVLPIINLVLGMLGFPTLSAEDVASWGSFFEWLAYALPAIIVVVVGWFTRPHPEDGTKPA